VELLCVNGVIWLVDRLSGSLRGTLMNDYMPVTVERSGARMSPAGSGGYPIPNDLFAQPSLEWRHAVHAATALVTDQWVLPETGSNSAVTTMAEELAPFLCAYFAL
jgi:hypothetical protein